MKRTLTKITAATALLAGAAVALAQAPAWMPTFTPDGVAHVPAFDLPPSAFMSKEGVEAQKARATLRMPDAITTATATSATTLPDIATQRRGLEAYLAPQVKEMLARYPVEIREQRIGGVRTRVITPRGGKIHLNRVLINLHGGGFNTCVDACAMMESAPIASVGGYKVITVDYRQGPEHVFPAASEDIAAVYRELLKTYKPKQIGIYGCSAGGALSGQAAAWLPAHGLPQAGAIGIFGAGAVRFGAGDSAHIAARIDGSFPPPPPPGAPYNVAGIRSYFAGTNMDDPMVSPAMHPAVLAKFPPTLVITGTRAMDMSPAVVTHSRLIDAGVPGDLIVAEGMGHCYIMQSQLPEAQSAYRAIVKFFRAHLG